ncbi:hypothetical protein Misp02_65470 [Microtetraspora sp. NBRC 16547]|nr:hypothetical protein Misp02_65470 [Microtetraspora sp. NBRC 16547]
MAPPGIPNTVSTPTCSSALTRAWAPVISSVIGSFLVAELSVCWHKKCPDRECGSGARAGPSASSGRAPAKYYEDPTAMHGYTMSDPRAPRQIISDTGLTI